jgi:hypothetical protein
MKKIFTLIIFSLLALSCDKDNDDANQSQWPNLHGLHAAEPGGLEKPDVILNEFATGIVHSDRIKKVTRYTYNNVNSTYNFSYVGQTNRIDEIQWVQNHYACEVTHQKYYYNADNTIDKIISTRVNPCFFESYVFVFSYNYDDGVLESIYMDNGSFIGETYFSYYPDGKIKKLYNSFRPKSDPYFYGFLETNYIYDSNGNLTSLTSTDDIAETSYVHDSTTNPFKGLYTFHYMPRLGGSTAVFSENNLSSATSTVFVSGWVSEDAIEWHIENGRILDYGNSLDAPDWYRYYITYY